MHAAATRILDLFRDNPVLVKELRCRMRGPKAYWLALGYVSLIALVLFMQYSGWYSRTVTTGYGLSGSSKVGRDFFWGLVTCQSLLAALIAPAVTAGAITIEREQKTLDLMTMTRLSTFAIVIGKLFSSVGFVSLLLVSSLPLASICFFLGGVSPQEMWYSYILMFFGSFLCGSFGLAWSSVCKSTSQAVTFTYLSLFLPVILGYIGLILYLNSFLMSGGQNSIIAACVGSSVGVIDSFIPFGNNSFQNFQSGTHYYFVNLPNWLPVSLTLFLVGLLLVNIASANIVSSSNKNHIWNRIIVAAIVISQTFFALGARFSVHFPGVPLGAETQAASVHPILLLCWPLYLILMLLPVFGTTGFNENEISNIWQIMKSGWRKGSLKAVEIGSGLKYLFALLGVILSIYALSFVAISKPGAITSGNFALQNGQTSNDYVTGIPAANRGGKLSTVGSEPRPTLIPILISVVTSVIGFASIGLLFSVVTKSRVASMALTYVFLLFVMIIPIITWISNANNPNVISGALTNLLYLNPLVALSEGGIPPDRFWSQSSLLFDHVPMWIINSLCHVGITVACILIIDRISKRTKERLATVSNLTYDENMDFQL